jgi:hypothetical protein
LRLCRKVARQKKFSRGQEGPEPPASEIRL